MVVETIPSYHRIDKYLQQRIENCQDYYYKREGSAQAVNDKMFEDYGFRLDAGNFIYIYDINKFCDFAVDFQIMIGKTK